MRKTLLGMLGAGFAMGCGGAKPDGAPAAATPAAQTSAAAPALGGQSEFQRIQEGMIIAAQRLSVLEAAVVRRDVDMVNRIYRVDALLRVDGDSVRGNSRIANRLLDLARTQSMTEFSRSSTGTRWEDSIVVDSGAYTMMGKRAGAGAVIQTGRYFTRLVPVGGGIFTIAFDSLAPDKQPSGAKPAKGRRS